MKKSTAVYLGNEGKMIHICESVKDNCWNIFDSYGEICVHCGCCSEDKKTRYKARLQVCKERIEELNMFHYWSDDEDVRKMQERNVKSDKQYWEDMLLYYQKISGRAKEYEL